MFPRTFRKSARAFTLLELLVVIGIIGLVATFAVPAISQMINGSTLTQASQSLTSTLSTARQYAITRNRAVEVRFLKFGDPETPGETVGDADTGQFRAVQLMEVLESGVAVPIDQVKILPRTVIMDSQALSSLLDKAEPYLRTPKVPDVKFDPELPRGIKRQYVYVSFRFQPNGTTNLAPKTNWYVTLRQLKDKVTGKTPPPNFFTLQVDPVSGTTRPFRPNLG
jgi:uncharacterized protein (TIGR02596 family)